jgi:hypothetical protein
MAEWGLGSFSSPDLAIRTEALETMKRGMGVSKTVGSPLVSLWPGQDGFDLLHFNDNYSEWDWDMIPKTFRFWEHPELIFWLRELGCNKWYSIDITMPRGDAIKVCQQSVVNIQRLCRFMDKLDRDQILANFHRMTIRRICECQIRCLRHWGFKATRLRWFQNGEGTPRALLCWRTLLFSRKGGGSGKKSVKVKATAEHLPSQAAAIPARRFAPPPDILP